jgi:hypothetical protein
LACNLEDLRLALGTVPKGKTKPWMIPGLLQVDDLSENRHQREEVPKHAMACTLDWRACLAISGELAGLPQVIIHRLQESLAFLV